MIFVRAPPPPPVQAWNPRSATIRAHEFMTTIGTYSSTPSIVLFEKCRVTSVGEGCQFRRYFWRIHPRNFHACQNRNLTRPLPRKKIKKSRSICIIASNTNKNNELSEIQKDSWLYDYPQPFSTIFRFFRPRLINFLLFFTLHFCKFKNDGEKCVRFLYVYLRPSKMAAMRRHRYCTSFSFVLFSEYMYIHATRRGREGVKCVDRT